MCQLKIELIEYSIANIYKMTTRSAASATRARNTSPSNSGHNLSRAQEKEQLETLNNRLAVYIDTVRRLEQDNRELKVRGNFHTYLSYVFSRLECHCILH